MRKKTHPCPRAMMNLPHDRFQPEYLPLAIWCWINGILPPQGNDLFSLFVLLLLSICSPSVRSHQFSYWFFCFLGIVDYIKAQFYLIGRSLYPQLVVFRIFFKIVAGTKVQQTIVRTRCMNTVIHRNEACYTFPIQSHLCIGPPSAQECCWQENDLWLVWRRGEKERWMDSCLPQWTPVPLAQNVNPTTS